MKAHLTILSSSLLAVIQVSSAFQLHSNRQQHRVQHAQSSTVVAPQHYMMSTLSQVRRSLVSLSSTRDDTVPAQKTNVREPPYPKIGDIVRYVDLDGGKVDGQVLVGKIALIQPVLTATSSNQDKQWLLEIAELDDVGDGYFADYPMRDRRFKRALRKLPEVSPVLASYVRSSDAYKVPLDANKVPIAHFNQYKIDGYVGPAAVVINEEVVATDGERYDELKGMLLRDAAVVGLIGTVAANFAYGTESALIYAAGATAGVLYLFFLAIKTDSLGSPGAKFGRSISNLRFGFPLFILVAVAVFNILSGSEDIGFKQSGDIFSTVRKDQFAAAMIGFLTYRIPLFLRQLQPVFGDSVSEFLPGSAGLAMQLASSKDGQATQDLVLSPDDGLTTVLLVCGPSGTGKTTLVKKLLSDDSDDRLVQPEWTDRNMAGAQFEVMERRGDFLKMDKTRRYGLSVDSIVNAADVDSSESEEKRTKKAVVVDADVELAKELSKVGNIRLVGVWVGLDSIEKIQERARAQMSSGDIVIPAGESEDSILRARVKNVVKDIEYGVLSGIFEFTILNDDIEESLEQIKAAAEYCFK